MKVKKMEEGKKEEAKVGQEVEGKGADERIEALEKKRVPCEVYSRVVGYIRPVSQWNEGKQEEFSERHMFSESAAPGEKQRASGAGDGK
jgi:anaerobic ribonucleoside-triphosphate reductase